ncbi:ShlB/FhaC/HecB family hemolysin secretion/activation protein, partial [Sphingomonas bacterium]|uniref:ShlB/FhaC/HecB family hemolysin secretion/activation protein n=1 Tax=Sphingomonas bacterium TaxID=1895847 RepID=UPI0015771001
VALAAVPAGAQTPQQPLPSQLPPTPTINLPTPTTAPPATTRVDTRGALPETSCPFGDSPIRLKLAAVRFTRSDGGALAAGVARSLSRVATPGGDQAIKVVCQLRDDANAALRRDGWLASVQIPAQSIDSGELRLQVVTARITDIRVHGTPGPYRKGLEARIRELRGLDPLNQRDAERALLLAGDIPGLNVQLSLRPAGTAPGDVIGDLSITYRPFAVLGNAQNFNSRQLGRETGYLRGELYGLTGLNDVAYLGASSTADAREQIIVQGGYTVGLGLSGLTLGPRVIYAWSRPDLGLLDLKTDTLIAGFDATLPLKRSLNTNLRAGVGVDYVNQTTRVSTTASNSVPLNADKLRIVFARLSGETGRRRLDGSILYSISGNVEARKGLGIFGATPVGGVSSAGAIPSRPDGDSRATVLRADLDVTIGLDRIFSLTASARGQYASDPLLNYEEFSLGNLTVGRGYDPGSNSGDRAIGLRIEPAARLPLRRSNLDAQLFGFYDAVALTNLDRGQLEVDRHLRSYGGGARLTLFNRLLFEAIYAHPLDRALTIDKAPPPDRVLVSLTAKFNAPAR